MAADDWREVAELGLAMRRRDEHLACGRSGAAMREEYEIARIEGVIKMGQARCQHVTNPERPERCYKCGAPPVSVVRREAGPGCVKAKRRAPLMVVVERKAKA